ncbi:MAG: patatin-like phospholipase family protein [Bacilli bacterium]|nr:patatin-like phospholipase family protein [Bacilli bacterium]
MEKIGLVLSGGGSKGAYEAGVYKALRKMHIKINIVTGTSIGAINGMMIVQKRHRSIMKFWKKVDFSAIYKEEEFPKMEDPSLAKVYSQYVKAFINEGGLNVSKMTKMFDSYFNPRKFFNSDIDYGVVTFNLSKRRPVIKTKKELDRYNAKDYMVASASCYPAFKPYVIDGDLYIDGGYYDNLPINLAIDLGATKIIAVDLRAVGFRRKIKDKSVEVTKISPRNKIASFLIFDKEKAKEAVKFGYNDTMKTFGKLDGDKFTFRKHNLINNYNKYNDIFEDKLNKIFNGISNPILSKIFQIPIFKETINRQIEYNNFNSIIEKSGEIFKFEEFIIYNINSYNKGLLNALANTTPIDMNIIKNKIIDRKITQIIDSRQIVKYFYNCIIGKDMSMIKYILLFRNEFLTALYIYTVKGLSINY